jgi:hypothetical protein
VIYLNEADWGLNQDNGGIVFKNFQELLEILCINLLNCF